ncbi:MAG: MBL fold metallo-hydrolase [Acidobacteria bacterium]|nr:MBL fold metallo-hydrolase [Acidobacteriota bacterium]
MNSTVTEIAADVYRISTFHPEYGIQFNQFLVKDDEPFLMHTGFKKMFPITRDAVATVLDPATVRWIGFSHFEPDECGAMNEWLAVAPQAQAVCSVVGNMVMMNDFADRPARALNDGEVFSTGKRRLRYLASPHFPHGWDAGLFFEETERTLFCSDLFFQPGDPQPLTESSLVEQVREIIKAGMASPLAHDMPYTPYTDQSFQRLAELSPRTLAIMHGSSFRGDAGRELRELGAIIKELLGTPA